MLVTDTITKKALESIVHQVFLNFGNVFSSYLLDSLKHLGFHYATTAGISINIEDLKTPLTKKDILDTVYSDIKKTSNDWQRGNLSEVERFQSIIDGWNNATENLKNKIVEYYQDFDPVNNLYIMAFSGARGNISQVRQLVGMRGLMSDQEGNIIDLPIQANFREGLTSLDYIISSYGARKGIVDTGLKTADSGYLTRRLIYVGQGVVIKEIDCKATKGITVILKKTTKCENLLGKTLVTATKYRPNSFKPTSLKSFKNAEENGQLIENIAGDVTLLEKKFLDQLKTQAPLWLRLRSTLTCESASSVCQKCYGFDLSRHLYIRLGECVGIIAAQSIGEPGTQLTMRTFHTGGIFTSELLEQTKAPFSGKYFPPARLAYQDSRTNHGVPVLKLLQEGIANIISWEGEKQEIILEAGSYLYRTKPGFIKKGEVITEVPTQAAELGKKKLTSVLSPIEGEVFPASLLIRPIYKGHELKAHMVENEGTIWIGSGKAIEVPSQALVAFSRVLSQKKSIARLKLISPIHGKLKISGAILTIRNKKESREIDIGLFTRQFLHSKTEIGLLVKNYQMIDSSAILAFFYIFPKSDEKIFRIKRRKNGGKGFCFFITESDIWRINSDQVTNVLDVQKKKLVKAGDYLNQTTILTRSGILLKKDGFQYVFQNAAPIFVTAGAILNYRKIDRNYISENQPIATLVTYQKQTEDIVQGLPKIEALFEARSPEKKAYLSNHPGVFFGDKITTQRLGLYSKSNGITTIHVNIEDKMDKLVSQSHREERFLENFNLYAYDMWDKRILAPAGEFERDEDVNMDYNETKYFPVFPIERPRLRPAKSIRILKKELKFKEVFVFQRLYPRIFGQSVPKTHVFWTQVPMVKFIHLANYHTPYVFDSCEAGRLKSLNVQNLYRNRHLIEKINALSEDNPSLKLKPLMKRFEQYSKGEWEDYKFFKSYYIPNLSKLATSPNSFLDIGEPITEGFIDPHDLLSVLFEYSLTRNGVFQASKESVHKFQLILVNSIQAIYNSQGVTISGKHVELIVRQLTSKVRMKQQGLTPFLPGEVVKFSLLNQINQALSKKKKLKQKNLNSDLEIHMPGIGNIELELPNDYRSDLTNDFMHNEGNKMVFNTRNYPVLKRYKKTYFNTNFDDVFLKNYEDLIMFDPIFIGATNFSLNRDSFLTAAGFQETKRVLTKAAIQGKSDWFKGLKESIIAGRLIPAGTAFLNYKNYLDNIYYFKDKLQKQLND